MISTVDNPSDFQVLKISCLKVVIKIGVEK